MEEQATDEPATIDDDDSHIELDLRDSDSQNSFSMTHDASQSGRSVQSARILKSSLIEPSDQRQEYLLLKQKEAQWYIER